VTIVNMRQNATFTGRDAEIERLHQILDPYKEAHPSLLYTMSIALVARGKPSLLSNITTGTARAMMVLSV
jgi:hypothetical protein